MEQTRYYPVIDCDTEGSVKAALFPCYSEDTVRKNHRVWLEESIPQHYRLCCKESFDRRTGGDIQLRCPKCGTVMQKVLPVTNGHRLGVYICPSCNKE